MSFVFYFPTSDLTDDKEQRNATVLYNSKLEAVYGTGFRKNSICVFVPRFHSYHGFATTIDRDTFVVLLVNKPESDAWDAMRKSKRDVGPEYDQIANIIEDKLTRRPLIEYGTEPERIRQEHSDCLVNAPQGRVMIG